MTIQEVTVSSLQWKNMSHCAYSLECQQNNHFEKEHLHFTGHARRPIDTLLNRSGLVTACLGASRWRIWNDTTLHKATTEDDAQQLYTHHSHWIRRLNLRWTQHTSSAVINMLQPILRAHLQPLRFTIKKAYQTLKSCTHSFLCLLISDCLRLNDTV